MTDSIREDSIEEEDSQAETEDIIMNIAETKDILEIVKDTITGERERTVKIEEITGMIKIKDILTTGFTRGNFTRKGIFPTDGLSSNIQFQKF